MVKFLIYIFLILHFQACTLLYIGMNNTDCWPDYVYPYTRDKDFWGSLYIASFYTIMVIFATVGYGDNHAWIRPEFIFHMMC